MQFSEAFKALGYQLESVRQDWSAINERGVCVSIWAVEMPKGRLSYDTRTDADPIEEWNSKPGSKKRMEHLSAAVRDFGGLVDVVIVQGQPKDGVTSAHPWLPKERKGARWFVTYLDEQTGHCAFEARLQ